MSLLDADFAENVDKWNVPISIELLHKLGWRWVPNVVEPKADYPDISKHPISGHNDWSPYAMANKDIPSIRVYMLNLMHNNLTAWKNNRQKWTIKRQPNYVLVNPGMGVLCHAYTWGQFEEYIKLAQLGKFIEMQELESRSVAFKSIDMNLCYREDDYYEPMKIKTC